MFKLLQFILDKFQYLLTVVKILSQKFYKKLVYIPTSTKIILMQI